MVSGFRWYFGKIKRMEAEKKLLLAQNDHGAYLIRDSESRRNDYSLSVRDGDTVKHHRIRQLDEGGFFIARRTTFRYFLFSDIRVCSLCLYTSFYKNEREKTNCHTHCSEKLHSTYSLLDKMLGHYKSWWNTTAGMLMAYVSI